MELAKAAPSEQSCTAALEEALATLNDALNLAPASWKCALMKLRGQCLFRAGHLFEAADAFAEATGDATRAKRRAGARETSSTARPDVAALRRLQTELKAEAALALERAGGVAYDETWAPLTRRELRVVVEHYRRKEEGSNDLQAVAAAVGKLKFFSRLEPDQVVSMLEMANLRFVCKSQYVFQQGDLASSMFCVLNGSVAIQSLQLNVCTRNSNFDTENDEMITSWFKCS